MTFVRRAGRGKKASGAGRGGPPDGAAFARSEASMLRSLTLAATVALMAALTVGIGIAAVELVIAGLERELRHRQR